MVSPVTAAAEVVESGPGWAVTAVTGQRVFPGHYPGFPVFPGDTVTSKLEWSADGDAWLCRAQVRTARGRAAQVRLRYEIREGR